MKRYFKRNFQSLEDIFDFIAGFVQKNKLDAASAYVVNLAVEEIFTNMVKYNSKNPGDVSIDLSRDANHIIISLCDSGAEPFDINRIAKYDRSVNLEKRPIGKLGIHLVKNMVDDIRYEYKNRQSKITLIKRLRNDHV